METKICIITPCSRPENIPKIMKTINFDYIHEWVIVYDGLKVNKIGNLENPKIKEFIHSDKNSLKGASQRNYAINYLKNFKGYVYFLDDDNTINPNLYDFLKKTQQGKIYTFNQERGKKVLRGRKIVVKFIDTSMFLIDFSLPGVSEIEWKNNSYHDYEYIKNVVLKFRENWVFINETLSYYNKLT